MPRLQRKTPLGKFDFEVVSRNAILPFQTAIPIYQLH